MRPAPATGRPLPRPVVRALVATGTGVLLLAGGAVGVLGLPFPATASAAVTSAISLVDDRNGAALFSTAVLSPGRVDTACVGLSASGSVDAGTEVELSAQSRSGDLARYLVVSVDRGSVPDGGSCASFSGERIFSGTLAEVPDADGPGIPTGWRPALAQRSVYRFSVTVLDDPAAQGLDASATFRWSLTEGDPPPQQPMPAPPPGPTPQPTEEPSPAPPSSTTPEPAPAAPATGSATPTAPVPAPTPTGATPGDPAGAGPTTAAPRSSGPAGVAATTTPVTAAAPTPGSPSPAVPGTQAAGGTDVIEAPPLRTGPVAAVAAAAQAVTRAVAQAAQQVAQTAVAVAHDGQFPLGLVAVVVVFLAVQGRLDRRDPKLALARVREELSEYRDFPEPPTTETT